MSDCWIEKVQEELNNEKAGHIPYLGDVKDVRPMPLTVCLVYMTEQHDGGQASYCEVYKDEDTARSMLGKVGFYEDKGNTHYHDVLLRKDEFSPYPDTATIVPEVKVKTDDA